MLPRYHGFSDSVIAPQYTFTITMVMIQDIQTLAILIFVIVTVKLWIEAKSLQECDFFGVDHFS